MGLNIIKVCHILEVFVWLDQNYFVCNNHKDPSMYLRDNFTVTFLEFYHLRLKTFTNPIHCWLLFEKIIYYKKRTVRLLTKENKIHLKSTGKSKWWNWFLIFFSNGILRWSFSFCSKCLSASQCFNRNEIQNYGCMAHFYFFPSIIWAQKGCLMATNNVAEKVTFLRKKLAPITMFPPK